MSTDFDGADITPVPAAINLRSVLVVRVVTVLDDICVISSMFTNFKYASPHTLGVTPPDPKVNALFILGLIVCVNRGITLTVSNGLSPRYTLPLTKTLPVTPNEPVTVTLVFKVVMPVCAKRLTGPDTESILLSCTTILPVETR